MSLELHHLLLAGSAAALAAAGWRIGAACGASGVMRVLAAAPIAAALAAAEAVGLGLVDLGSSPAALSIAAFATWFAARSLMPPPVTRAFEDLRQWWGERSLGARVLAGTAAGLWLGWFWFLLRSPAIGFDGVQYHFTEVQAWIDNGRPGSIVPISHELPFANYPLTNEVLLAWTAGIATSWVAVAAWGPLAMALIGLSMEAGLRVFGVAPLLRLLTATALITLPISFQQLNDASTDLHAFAWLAVTGALAAGSRERPGLLAPALVAGALAVGTKTTVALPALAVLAAGAWISRDRLRELRRPLLFALALGVAAGGLWYLRNLFDHGSPLWPFVELPWGDPTPPFLDRFDSSLLANPSETLDGNLDAYRDRVGGGLLLLAGAVLLPIVARRKVALGAGLVALAGLLLWAAAPVTGASRVPGFATVTLSTVRYLLPVLGVAAAAVALSSGARFARPAAIALLLAAIVWNVDLDGELGPAHLPPFPTVRNGMLLGALGALALSLPLLRSLALSRAGLVTALVAGALITAPSADRYVENHGRFNVTFDSPLTRWFAAQPGYRDGDQEIAMVRTTAGPLAGSRLRHRVLLIPASESCTTVRARASRGWVVLSDIALENLVPVRALRCFGGQRPDYEDGRFRVFTDRPTVPAR